MDGIHQQHLQRLTQQFDRDDGDPDCFVHWDRNDSRKCQGRLKLHGVKTGASCQNHVRG